MKDYKFIYKDHDVYVCGQVKNKRLIEYFDLESMKIGNIYRGRVEKYLKTMDAYLVDLGLDKKGLLRKSNTIKEVKGSDHVLVEIINEGQDHKLYEVSEKYTISSPYLVLNPFNHIKKNLIDKDIGYFLRTRAKNLENDFIQKGYEGLVQVYNKLEAQRNKLPTPKLLRSGNFLRDYIVDYDKEIISNINFGPIKAKKDFNPAYVEEISIDLAKSKERRVDIGDISISIDQLEALTVVDVNSSHRQMDTDKEDFSLDVNLHSIEEIAIQISLRQIKKMLIIDFLRMNKENKDHLISAINRTFKEYKLDYKIMGFSNMGFLEVLIF